MKKEKEFLYVGYYTDTDNRKILKIGTTDNLQRRQKEHNRYYKTEFKYLWSLPLSKYNTIRFEDINREAWKQAEIGEYIRNDRFVLHEAPPKVTVKIRKEYTIDLAKIFSEN